MKNWDIIVADVLLIAGLIGFALAITYLRPPMMITGQVVAESASSSFGFMNFYLPIIAILVGIFLVKTHVWNNHYRKRW
jgi:hypothetical protein